MLFGLKTGYSDRALGLRRELSRLEAAVVAGRVSDAQVERYRELSKKLVSSPSARVDEIAGQMEAKRTTEQ
jgi:hypothetical protein